MKYLQNLYRFLGGVYFAIILIGTVTIFVVAGTLIESQTQSHRYAALLTYGSPFSPFFFGDFLLTSFFLRRVDGLFKQNMFLFSSLISGC